jgi:hypothetical protein
MVGFTAEGEVPSAVRPDRRRDGHRLTQIDERPALFDMELDVDADAIDQRVVGAEMLGSTTGVGQRIGEREAVVVPQPQRAFGCQRTGAQL